MCCLLAMGRVFVSGPHLFFLFPLPLPTLPACNPGTNRETFDELQALPFESANKTTLANPTLHHQTGLRLHLHWHSMDETQGLEADGKMFDVVANSITISLTTQRLAGTLLETRYLDPTLLK